MEIKDIYLYRKLILLARKQLASINERLSNPESGKWNEFVFKLRHSRIKNILIDILGRREEKAGDGAVLELINDLKDIEVDEIDWQDAAKEETDYLRFVLHGIRAVSEDEDNDSNHEDET